MELAVLVPDINFLHSNQTLLSKVSSLLASNSNVRFFIPLVVLEELNVHQVRPSWNSCYVTLILMISEFEYSQYFASGKSDDIIYRTVDQIVSDADS